MDENLLRDVGNTIEREFEARGWRHGSPIGSIPNDTWRTRANGIPVPTYARDFSPPLPPHSPDEHRTARNLRHAFWRSENTRAAKKRASMRLLIVGITSAGFVVLMGLLAWVISR
jgi:hypothetical protein